MFRWLKRKHKQPTEGTQYSFVWYKKMQANGQTFYTQPFRTKVSAKSYEEARNKVAQFALGKMKLVIVPEDSFGRTDLADFQKQFDDLNKKMNDLFKSFE